MAPIKRKKCCVPYCNNAQEKSKKQFFKMGANLEGREKWLSSVGKGVAAKSQILYCCEDHFDLPNDAENYIRCKYVPGTKLKLRPNVLPQKKLPLNVCRLCLKLIYNGEDFVDVSEKNGGKNAQIIAATLPELDLSITVEPVVCVKCFDPLEQYYKIKQKALNSEVIVVNCIKSIVKRSPTRFIKNCEIDLFEDYNDIVELLEKEKERTKTTSEDPKIIQEQPEVIHEKHKMDKNTEEIVIQIEESSDNKCHIETVQENKFKSGQNQLKTLLEGRSNYRIIGNSQFGQENFALVESMSFSKVSGNCVSENEHASSEKTEFPVRNVESLQNISSNNSVKSNDNMRYEIENTVGPSSENMYICVEKEPSESPIVIVTRQL